VFSLLVIKIHRRVKPRLPGEHPVILFAISNEHLRTQIVSSPVASSTYSLIDLNFASLENLPLLGSQLITTTHQLGIGPSQRSLMGWRFLDETTVSTIRWLVLLFSPSYHHRNQTNTRYYGANATRKESCPRLNPGHGRVPRHLRTPPQTL
jgi:hypothetical protein